MYAVISPRDHEAGLLCDENGRVRVLDLAGARARSQSVARYFSRHPDTMVVEVRDGTHAVEVLGERATMSMCLDMALLLFEGIGIRVAYSVQLGHLAVFANIFRHKVVYKE